MSQTGTVRPFNAIVLGMPRSGTSLSAAIFARHGYFLAEHAEEELRPGDEHNPSGYFEAEGLIERNVSLFRRVGYQAHNTWLFEPISSQQADALQRLKASDTDLDFIRRYEQHRPWLWKDPRLCYTLAYWWPLIDAGSTRVLVLRRRPEEIWNSFVRLDWRRNTEAERQDVYRRIDHHIDTALETIARLRIPHEIVHYDEFSTDPRATAEKISNCFNLRLDARALGFDGHLNSTTLARRLATFLRRQRDGLSALIPDAVKDAIRTGR
ncbi:MAG: sulfotransferase [Pseudomonadales bacterium]|nr:sulfotransferase [Pseudomonadales bacterium]MCP5185797.1 sulfotransferase [Pseudomonadales bacterium]